MQDFSLIPSPLSQLQSKQRLIKPIRRLNEISVGLLYSRPFVQAVSCSG